MANKDNDQRSDRREPEIAVKATIAGRREIATEIDGKATGAKTAVPNAAIQSKQTFSSEKQNGPTRGNVCRAAQAEASLPQQGPRCRA